MSKEVKPGQNRFISVTCCNECPKNGCCKAWRALSREQKLILNIGNAVPPDFMLKDCQLELMPEAKLEQLKDALKRLMRQVEERAEARHILEASEIRWAHVVLQNIEEES